MFSLRDQERKVVWMPISFCNEYAHLCSSLLLHPSRRGFGDLVGFGEGQQSILQQKIRFGPDTHVNQTLLCKLQEKYLGVANHML